MALAKGMLHYGYDVIELHLRPRSTSGRGRVGHPGAIPARGMTGEEPVGGRSVVVHALAPFHIHVIE